MVLTPPEASAQTASFPEDTEEVGTEPGTLPCPDAMFLRAEPHRPSPPACPPSFPEGPRLPHLLRGQQPRLPAGPARAGVRPPGAAQERRCRSEGQAEHPAACGPASCAVAAGP